MIEVNHIGGFALLSMVFLSLGTVTQQVFKSRKFNFITQPSISIIFGLFAGFFLVMGNMKITLSKDLIFDLFLPLILFNEGFHISLSKMWLVIRPGILIGFFFTFIQIAILGLILSLLNNGYLQVPGSQILLLAVVLSSKDGLVALESVQHSDHEKLHNVIHLEELFNEIVILSLFKGVEEDIYQSVDGVKIYWLFLIFMVQLIVCMTIGVAIGLIATLVSKYVRALSLNSLIAQIFLIQVGFISFLSCESIEYSGAIASLFSASIIKNYGRFNMNEQHYQDSKNLLQVLSAIFQQIIYFYIGISVWSVIPFNNEASETPWVVTFAIIPIILGIRILSMFALSFLPKLKKKIWTMTMYERFILCYTGIIRGTVAYAIISNLNDEEMNEHKDPKEPVHSTIKIQHCVLMVIVLTNLLFGGVLRPISKYLLKKNSKVLEKERYLKFRENEAIRIEENEQLKQNLNQRYFYRFLVFNYGNRSEEIALLNLQGDHHHDHNEEEGIVENGNQEQLVQSNIISERSNVNVEFDNQRKVSDSGKNQLLLE